MTWQLNMKACGRTSPASRTTTGNEHKENTERDDRAGNHQRLNVTRQFVEPSTEACQRNKRNTTSRLILTSENICWTCLKFIIMKLI